MYCQNEQVTSRSADFVSTNDNQQHVNNYCEINLTRCNNSNKYIQFSDKQSQIKISTQNPIIININNKIKLNKHSTSKHKQNTITPMRKTKAHLLTTHINQTLNFQIQHLIKII